MSKNLSQVAQMVREALEVNHPDIEVDVAIDFVTDNLIVRSFKDGLEKSYMITRAKIDDGFLADEVMKAVIWAAPKPSRMPDPVFTLEEIHGYAETA